MDKKTIGLIFIFRIIGAPIQNIGHKNNYTQDL
jgi:hypothetical protein